MTRETWVPLNPPIPTSEPLSLLSTPARKTLTDREATSRPEVFKFRNFDPETGLARKHARTEESETVEKQTDGLADEVIAQDEQARAQELVSPPAYRPVTPTALTTSSSLSPVSQPFFVHYPFWHPAVHSLGASTITQDLTNIQPKKANWDLKRDLERKVRLPLSSRSVLVDD